MKILIKIIITLVLVILLSLLLIPYFFIDKVEDRIIVEANKRLKARMSFEDISLNFFTNFPSATIGIEELSIIGKEKFENDTLLYMDELSLSVDLLQLLENDHISIQKILLNKAYINIINLTNGEVNYDIVKDSSEATNDTTEEEEDNMAIKLQQFVVKNSTFIYDNREMQLYSKFENFSGKMKADLTAEKTDLFLDIQSKSSTLISENIPLLSKVNIRYKASILADLENSIFTLKKNQLSLNDFKIGFDGNFSLVNDDLNTTLAFESPENNFKSLLSLIPAFYQESFDNIIVKGKFGFKGNIKGIYSETSLPDFKLSTYITDGNIQYPELQQAFSSIQLKLDIVKKGGDMDNMVIHLSQLNLRLGENPLTASLLVKTPISDPDIQAKLNTDFDLNSINDFYPIENATQYSGNLKADIQLKGKLSSIEKEEYQDFNALGSIFIDDMKYFDKDLQKTIEVQNAQLNFAPEYLDLVNLQIQVEKNDLSLQGKVKNYFAYYLDRGKLLASFKLQSNHLNINDFMTSSSADTSTQNTSATELIRVPKNLQVDFQADIQNLIYDNMQIAELNGVVKIEDQALRLDNLSMKLDQAQMYLAGLYNSKPNLPISEMQLNIQNIEAKMMFKYFDIIQKYFPIAKNIQGELNTNWSFRTQLTKEMKIAYETLDGGGSIRTSKLHITELKAFNKIVGDLHLNQFKSPEIDPLNIKFTIHKGNIKTEKFPLIVGDFKGTMEGYTGLDQSINYQFKTTLPKRKLSQNTLAATKEWMKRIHVFNMDIGIPSEIPLSLVIKGNINHPKTSFSISENGSSIQQQAKKKVKEEIEKKKKEVSKEARKRAKEIIQKADTQAKRLIKEAEDEAKTIKDEARKTAKKINEEADKKATRLVNEAEGFIAKTAAKEAAKGIRQEAKNQANELIKKADKEAGRLVNKAKAQSSKLKKNAQQQADKITKI